MTLRNAFRYKSRMFMTIFGVMGSISLLILGIGIRDSLIELVPSQYEHISAYDMIAVYNPGSSNVASYQKIIKNDANHELAIGYETFYANPKSFLIANLSKLSLLITLKTISS
ncbi:efflux ABC transporter, permease domain protein [Streptococcus mutans]|nr:efflux ABC transporter, permease domain protein [Streptococcus mutans]